MAIRSFQQIMDSHEAAQAMLRSLEVDVRDTLANAKAELARFRAPGVTAAAPKEYGDYKAGDTFVCMNLSNVGVTPGSTYTLQDSTLGLAQLAFRDDDGDERQFYWWYLES